MSIGESTRPGHAYWLMLALLNIGELLAGLSALAMSASVERAIAENLNTVLYGRPTCCYCWARQGISMAERALNFTLFREDAPGQFGHMSCR